MKINFVIALNKGMKTIPLFLFVLSFTSCKNSTSTTNAVISSPGSINSIEFFLNATGTPEYLVKHKGKVIIDSSSMGFDFKGHNSFKDKFVIKKTTEKSFNETWEMPWGEQRLVLNNYKELLVELEESASP